MDLTQGTKEEKNNRAKKMMLWFGIVSLIMSFAGLTSAFIVSSSREDWIADYQLPNAFWISTVVIIISSITMFFAKKALKDNNRSLSTLFLVITFIFGIVFIAYQFIGFNQLIEKGYNMTLYYFLLIGPMSNVTMSYIYVIVIAHMLHIIVGLICLMVVIYNHFRHKYTKDNMLGFELASTFWHFVDILWLYLFFFLYFFNN